jgi:plasmid rolling circle replication initiator protein Rep
MSLEAWGEAWRQALSVDYIPSIKVQRLRAYGKSAVNSSESESSERSALLSAVAEVSKYATKSADYIYPDDWDLTVSAVRILDAALNSRRLIAYGGNCLKAQRALKLDDADNGDLVNIGDELENKDLPYEIVSYAWNTGYKQYGRFES